MPNTYEYKCGEHGHFQRREPMDQDHKASCPTCSLPARREFGFAGFRQGNPLFHQDGSYDTDGED